MAIVCREEGIRMTRLTMMVTREFQMAIHTTFWKSNPYLDSVYTHESNDLHPQWVIVDLGKKYRINAIQINWGNPYALNYKVDYAKGNDPQYFDPFEPGIWHSFSQNIIDNSKERNNIKKISEKPVLDVL